LGTTRTQDIPMWGVLVLKAISIRQPWANLVVEGLKDVEIRTWRPQYRGVLYVHASSSYDKVACRLLRRNPEDLRRGAILAKCQLVDVIEYTSKRHFTRDGVRHRNPGRLYDGRQCGLVLENIEVLEEPIPCKGQLGLWNCKEVISAHGQRRQ